MAEIRLKRAYEAPAPDDGLRILVERLWPRGLSKGRAAVDLWIKDVAPSPELRRWFHHDPAGGPSFGSATAPNFGRSRTLSRSSGRSAGGRPSPSSTRRRTRSTTAPLS